MINEQLVELHEQLDEYSCSEIIFVSIYIVF